MNESATGNRSGQCLCGAVKIHAFDAEERVGACHCRHCRRWSGGPFLELECGVEVSFEGEENIGIYASSDWAERGFCKLCGSHLFIRVKEDNSAGLPAGYGVPPGLFDDEEGLQLHLQVFLDQKPEFYSFANETTEVTSKEVYELFPSLHHTEQQED